MPAGRFVVPPELLAPGEIELPGDIAHQARDVLRLVPGETLILLDGRGAQWLATLTVVDRRAVRAHLARAGHDEPLREPRLRLTLYQGMLKAAKFEWVLQKGTELGIAAFVPLVSERAVAGTDELGSAKRTRWQRLLVEATEQCGRERVPTLAEPMPLGQALRDLPGGALALIPWEQEHGTSLRAAALAHPRSPQAHLFIGPEGGFSAEEVGLARQRGAVPVTLGRRILRAETAALAATALLLEAFGDLD